MSTTRNSPLCKWNSAWRRLTVTSSRKMSLSGCRPADVTGWSSKNREPAFGPRLTTTTPAPLGKPSTAAARSVSAAADVRSSFSKSARKTEVVSAPTSSGLWSFWMCVTCRKCPPHPCDLQRFSKSLGHRLSTPRDSEPICQLALGIDLALKPSRKTSRDVVSAGRRNPGQLTTQPNSVRPDPLRTYERGRIKSGAGRALRCGGTALPRRHVKRRLPVPGLGQRLGRPAHVLRPPRQSDDEATVGREVRG